jgi:hypothetical protein
LLLVLKAEQMSKPSVFLTNVYRSEVVPVPLRIAAATAAAPYVEARVTDRKISCPINLPPSNSVEQARANINLIKAHIAAGALGIEEGEVLLKIEQLLVETNMCVDVEQGVRALEALARDNPPQAGVEVRGGLPPLSGTNIDMPKRPLLPSSPWKSKGSE